MKFDLLQVRTFLNECQSSKGKILRYKMSNLSYNIYTCYNVVKYLLYIFTVFSCMFGR